MQRLSLVESAANPGRQTRPHVAASVAQLRAPSHLTTYDTADSPERMLAARNVRNVASRDVSNLAAGVGRGAQCWRRAMHGALGNCQRLSPDG